MKPTIKTATDEFRVGQRVRIINDHKRSLLCDLRGGRAGIVAEIGVYFVGVRLDGEDGPRFCYDTELEAE